MRSKKIIIAGGAGYIGSSLVPYLQESGYKVGVIDLLWFGNNLKEKFVLNKNILDLTESWVDDADTVIFLAGLSNDPMAEFSPKLNFIYNTAAPAHLAYISKKAGVKKFIYASSCSVYGNGYDEECSEDTIASSQYPYGISKLQGELAVNALKDSNFQVICFRQGTVSGYSPRMRFDLIVNTMIKCAKTTGTITVNNPKIWRPILSIKDAVRAYDAALAYDKDESHIFNLSSGNYTVMQVAEAVKDRLPEVEIVKKDIVDFRNYRVSTSKIENVLGFKSEDGLDDIIDDVVVRRSYGDLTNPKYYNIEIFKALVEEGRL